MYASPHPVIGSSTGAPGHASPQRRYPPAPGPAWPTGA